MKMMRIMVFVRIEGRLVIMIVGMSLVELIVMILNVIVAVSLRAAIEVDMMVTGRVSLIIWIRHIADQAYFFFFVRLIVTERCFKMRQMRKMWMQPLNIK